MSLRLSSILFIFFITGSQAFGAPIEDIPLIQSPERTDVSNENREKSQELKNHFTIAQPPPDSAHGVKSDNDEVYSFRQAFSGGAGAVAGTDSGVSNGWNFQYLLPSDSNDHYEVGADLFTDGIGAFNFGIRRFSRKLAKLRPYLKAGVAIRTDGESGLAEFVQLSNFRARAAAGFEKLWISPLSYRLEVEASLGQNEQFIFLKAALSWAWY